MIAVLIFLTVAAGSPVNQNLAEAEKALSAGRIEQARAMVSAAVRSGARGDGVDRMLADLAFEARNNEEALALYLKLLARRPDDPQLLEQTASAALRVGKTEQAIKFLDRAIAKAPTSWRAWNAKGVAADLSGSPDLAEPFYLKAAALAPNEAEILNNLGWSRALRGEWKSAIEPLERAVALSPKNARPANNLELARAAVSAMLPQRRPGETANAWAERLNDAGVIAQIQGDQPRAIAAFSLALEARGAWYKRAANNLQIAQSAR